MSDTTRTHDTATIDTATTRTAERAHEFNFDASIAGAAAFANAEMMEILNLLGDDASGGACCGGDCCTTAE